MTKTTTRDGGMAWAMTAEEQHAIAEGMRHMATQYLADYETCADDRVAAKFKQQAELADRIADAVAL